MYISKHKYVYKVSKRSLYLCVLKKLSRHLRCEDLQKHKLRCFCCCNFYCSVSLLLLWNLFFTHLRWVACQFFFADWIRYNHVINKSSCDWNKFSLITEAAIFLNRKHLKYACLYAKIHSLKLYYVLNNNMYIHIHMYMNTLYIG